VTVVGSGEDLLLDAVYHDTVDLRLARSGVTLRRRSGGADAGWHLKLPIKGDARDEIRAKKDGKRVPKELADLVLGLTRGEPLAPVAHIRTKRKRWELLDKNGKVAAELVEDDVEAQTLGENEQMKAWREIEVELVAGGREVFETVERTLGRPSKAPAKLMRLLEERIPKRPKADGVTGYVQQQVEEMRRQDLRIRQDADDAVHRMRVASRRIRSVLQAYKGSRALKEELRWLGTVLGEARDLEVLHGHLRKSIDELPAELVLGNVRQRLTETFAPREQQARAKVVEALRGKRYFALLNRLETVKLRLNDGRLRKTKKRVAKAWRDEANNRATLHDVRKAAKRARYAAEAAGKEKLARRMKKLTKRLGEHQDSVVARQELRSIGIQSHLDGDNAYTYGLLHGCELHRADNAKKALRRKV
jgi:CHAD domain-containing protein